MLASVIECVGAVVNIPTLWFVASTTNVLVSTTSVFPVVVDMLTTHADDILILSVNV